MTAKKKVSSFAWLDTPLACQRCKDKGKSVSMRSDLYVKGLYEGPCGDSFCYFSCDSPCCKPVSALLCDNCFKEVKK